MRHHRAFLAAALLTLGTLLLVAKAASGTPFNAQNLAGCGLATYSATWLLHLWKEHTHEQA